MQNTYKHISDKSLFVTFDPTGSGYPESVTNVQDALSKIGPWALTDNGLPKASETVEGIIRLSTQKEVDDGISNNTAVTPKTLAERLNHPEASETVLGLTQYATNAEALNGLLTNRSIVASSLDYVLNTRTSTESKTGTIKISTGLQAEAGEDDTTAMTPKKVKQAINKLTPSIGIATETNTGTVTLATAGIAQAGTAHDGVAISPKIFVSARATDTKVGTTKIANTTEAKDKSNNTVVLSPKALQEIKGSNTEFGLIKLSENISNDANTALSSKAQVVFKNFTINGKPLQGNGITITAGDIGAYTKGETWSRAEADNRYAFKGNISSTGSGGTGDSWMTIPHNLKGSIVTIWWKGWKNGRIERTTLMIGFEDEQVISDQVYSVWTSNSYNQQIRPVNSSNYYGFRIRVSGNQTQIRIETGFGFTDNTRQIMDIKYRVY